MNSGRADDQKAVQETVRPPANAFACAAPQIGDLTVPCPEREQADADAQSLTVNALPEQLGAVTAFVDAFLEACDCPMKTQMQIDLCVEEIFVNIANYAYGENTGSAEIRISEADGVVTLRFADWGTPYDPHERADPDVTLSEEERQIGGLGIFLVKKIMDTVSYRYENGKNILTLSKALHGDKPAANE